MRDRPVNLNLFTISFPITAIVSILHRISGLILLLVIPLFLALLQTLIFAPEYLAEYFSVPFNKALVIAILTILIYHLCSGVRHLLMDIGFGESRVVGRITSFTVLVLAFGFSILLGYTIW